MTFKDLDTKGKIEHIIYYYKWHIVLSIIGVLCAVSLLYTMFIKPPIKNYNGIAMYGQFLSINTEDCLQKEIADILQLPENNRIIVDSYYSDDTDPMVEASLMQKLGTYLYSNQYQLIVANENDIKDLAASELLYPMAAYYTKDEIANLSKQYDILYTTNPETGKEDAFAINLKDSALLKKYQLYEDNTPYVAFVPQPKEFTENTFATLAVLLKNT